MAVKSIRVYVVTLDRDPVTDSVPLNCRAADRMAQADPFIVDLIHKLQDDVREQRGPQVPRMPESRWSALRGEAPPPLGEWPMDFEIPDRDDDWPLLRDLELDD